MNKKIQLLLVVVIIFIVGLAIKFSNSVNTDIYAYVPKDSKTIAVLNGTKLKQAVPNIGNFGIKKMVMASKESVFDSSIKKEDATKSIDVIIASVIYSKPKIESYFKNQGLQVEKGYYFVEIDGKSFYTTVKGNNIILSKDLDSLKKIVKNPLKKEEYTPFIKKIEKKQNEIFYIESIGMKEDKEDIFSTKNVIIEATEDGLNLVVKMKGEFFENKEKLVKSFNLDKIVGETNIRYNRIYLKVSENFYNEIQKELYEITKDFPIIRLNVKEEKDSNLKYNVKANQFLYGKFSLDNTSNLDIRGFIDANEICIEFAVPKQIIGELISNPYKRMEVVSNVIENIEKELPEDVRKELEEANKKLEEEE